MIVKYVLFKFPGSFFSEEFVVRLGEQEREVPVPEGCFGYQTYKRRELMEGGQLLAGSPWDHSPMTYFGEALTLDQVRALPGDHRILVSNMEGNRYASVVRTVRGNWQPLEKGDVVLPSAPSTVLL